MIVIVGSPAVLVAAAAGPGVTYGRWPVMRVRISVPSAKP